MDDYGDHGHDTNDRCFYDHTRSYTFDVERQVIVMVIAVTLIISVAVVAYGYLTH